MKSGCGGDKSKNKEQNYSNEKYVDLAGYAETRTVLATLCEMPRNDKGVMHKA
jgi:hypothetical protein